LHQSLLASSEHRATIQIALAMPCRPNAALHGLIGQHKRPSAPCARCSRRVTGSHAVPAIGPACIAVPAATRRASRLIIGAQGSLSLISPSRQRPTCSIPHSSRSLVVARMRVFAETRTSFPSPAPKLVTAGRRSLLRVPIGAHNSAVPPCCWPAAFPAGECHARHSALAGTAYISAS
jgi:hypothetical protein